MCPFQSQIFAAVLSLIHAAMAPGKWKLIIRGNEVCKSVNKQRQLFKIQRCFPTSWLAVNLSNAPFSVRSICLIRYHIDCYMDLSSSLQAWALGQKYFAAVVHCAWTWFQLDCDLWE